MTAVPRDAWHEAVMAEVSGGFTFPDLLTGIDRGEGVEVLIRLVDPSTATATVLTTVVDDRDPHVASVVDLLPGAAWHERETAEMFGVVFDGHPTPGPLLLRETPDRPPLRSTTPLPERLAQPWPGTVEAEPGRRARRRSLPPGVRESWLESDA